MTTTNPMPYIDCLRWMFDRGYRLLMWPSNRIAGAARRTQFEPLDEAIAEYAAGDRHLIAEMCFVAEGPSEFGEDLNAYLYVLPAGLDVNDEAGTAEEIERLRDGPQWLEHPTLGAEWANCSAYRVAGTKHGWL